ncbi:uncharacterized protein M421DRAFT_160637 [Didymella exigua CBS 183.55]|uniref:Uncharacterized protein n=1 Tax=Didymella exigua CBS 183.55 TaxID=1150837 RepID=A0A6A5RSF2_9PLEO|nr:uncharacterized protein M421DRAFT_160637 [Didymella exigua CBS 183.55]KAF1928427.1 hypothetical protein M421DRAFT_160637 [Didymella exigua CBS 183.55]
MDTDLGCPIFEKLPGQIAGAVLLLGLTSWHASADSDFNAIRLRTPTTSRPKVTNVFPPYEKVAASESILHRSSRNVPVYGTFESLHVAREADGFCRRWVFTSMQISGVYALTVYDGRDPGCHEYFVTADLFRWLRAVH